MEPLIRISGDGSEYIGKRLLVGMSYYTAADELIRQEQFFGIIVSANANEIVIERADTGRRHSLPPETQKARPGRYRLRTSGKVVVDPDYLATWKMKEDDSPNQAGTAD